MDEQQIKALGYDELRQLIIQARSTNTSDYPLLRRECLRRIEGWNRISNCAGGVILLIFLLVILVSG